MSEVSVKGAGAEGQAELMAAIQASRSTDDSPS
jgi:hypothetical protein